MVCYSNSSTVTFKGCFGFQYIIKDASNFCCIAVLEDKLDFSFDKNLKTLGKTLKTTHEEKRQFMAAKYLIIYIF